MTKLSDKDLSAWQEETKDVKKLKKNSHKKHVEFLLDFNGNEKLKRQSEVAYSKQMLKTDELSVNDFIGEHAFTGIGTIHSARKSLDKRTQSKLKAGQYKIERKLDLHGMTLTQAHDSLIHFLQESAYSGLKCVLIVHGKGIKKDSNIGLIKQQIPHWLEATPCVLSFTSAQNKHGGSGALYVLLKTKR